MDGCRMDLPLGGPETPPDPSGDEEARMSSPASTGWRVLLATLALLAALFAPVVAFAAHDGT